MRHLTDVDENALAASFLGVVAILVLTDVAADAWSGTDLLHLSIELASATVALVGGAVFLGRMWDARAEAARWRAQAEELLAGVGQSIAEQFDGWGLTDAEKEVGALLLKGLAMKEIAAVRETSERTARDQARSVYKKAGVAGRAELSAWFLEDLLPAPEDG